MIISDKPAEAQNGVFWTWKSKALNTLHILRYDPWSQICHHHSRQGSLLASGLQTFVLDNDPNGSVWQGRETFSGA